MDVEVKDVKQLKEEMGAKMAQVDTAKKIVDELAAKEDTSPEDLTAAKEAYDIVAKQFDELTDGLDEADKYAKRQAALARVTEIARPADAQAATVGQNGFAPSPDKVVGKVIDHDELDRARCKAFCEWSDARTETEVKGFASETEKAKLVFPESDRWTNQKNVRQFGFMSAVMPASIACQVMGPNFAKTFHPEYLGKAIMSLNNAVSNPSLAHNLVPQEFVRRLLMLPTPRPNLLNKVTILPCQTGVLTLPQLVQTASNEVGGISMTWGGEGSTKGETDPTFGQIDITTYELNGYTAITERAASRSAIALEPLLVNLYRRAINIEVDRVILNGNGTGQPTGIIGAAGVNVLGRTTAGTVVYADLTGLKHQLAHYHRANADWVLSDNVELALENLAETTGGPLFNASLAAGPYDRIVGYPYTVHYSSPAIGANGDLIFGDFSEYYLAVEEEIVVGRSEHFLFRTNQVAYKVFMVIGGRPANPRAFATLAGTSGS